MIATNHATTGALIAVSVNQPVLAIPLAFASHFVLDSMPHFGYKEQGLGYFFRQKTSYVAMAIDLTGLVLLISLLVNFDLLVWICAIVAVSPDFIWIGRYFFFERTGKKQPGINQGPFSRFHSHIQWFEKPHGLLIEAFLAGFLLLTLQAVV